MPTSAQNDLKYSGRFACQVYTKKIDFQFLSRWMESMISMIVMTVFLAILNKIEFHLVQNRKKNCHHIVNIWFIFYFEPNVISFGSKSKGKLSPYC